MDREEETHEYDLMMLLDQLETLREDMLELGIKSFSEVETRITDLHSRLDVMENKRASEE